MENNSHSRKFRHSKCDKEIAEAQEKLNRRLQYSREVASTGKDTASLQVDSITRIVVRDFRKVINCERCSLFLMDHSSNELYFKPVGGVETGTDVGIQEIRFPADKGIAGWVAMNKQIVNIKDAYLDARFYKEVDQRTNFRTKSVLCMPVISNSQGGGDHLLGVVQMLNKVIPEKVKKEKRRRNIDMIYSGSKRNIEEGFTKEDVITLERCCKEVAKALDNIKRNRLQQGTCELRVDFCVDIALPQGKEDSATLSTSLDIDSVTMSENETVKKVERRKGFPRKNGRRHSSIGSLVQFVSSKTMKPVKQDLEKFSQGAGVSEALSRFQFRSTSGQQITAKGQMQGDADFAAAANKRKRMTEYMKQRENDGNQDKLALSVSLWNISTKFKQLLNAEMCRIFFLEANHEFYFRSDHAGSRLPVSHGVVGSVVTLGKRVLINDANKDPRVKESFEMLNGSRPRTVCCQPVHNAEKAIIAFIELASEQNFAFNVRHIKSLELYAQKVSLALSAIRDDLLMRRGNESSHTSNNEKLSAVASFYAQKLNEIASQMAAEINEEDQRIKRVMKKNSRMEMTANEAAARFQFRSNTVIKPSSLSQSVQKAPESNKNWAVFKKLFDDG